MYDGRILRAGPAVALLVLATGCTAPAAPPPAVAPAETQPQAVPVAIDFPHTRVWTGVEDVVVRGDSSSTAVARPFTALEVIAADTGGISVRCASCPGEPVGRVRHTEVVHTPLSPAEAAWGTLGEFALALREAAARADTAALLPVMNREFTFSFVGTQGPAQALAVWSAEDLAPLALIPRLLDTGLARGPGGVWAAPPEHFESPGYDGLRLGFRRSANGSWEWLFLIRGER